MDRSTILDRIVVHKREEIARKRAQTPLAALHGRASGRQPPSSLYAALARPGLSVIAEIKRRSPSHAAYATEFSPAELAATYLANGAAAISVLADEAYFGSGADVIAEVVNVVQSARPVIYKDFVIDPYQVVEARALGADAVLIIVRATDVGALSESVACATALGMDCVIEIFVPQDIECALQAGARIIGINNRDLATFAIDMERSARLRTALPPDVLAISESGLACAADVRRAWQFGFDAVLVGEAILGARDVAGKVRELTAAVAFTGGTHDAQLA